MNKQFNPLQVNQIYNRHASYYINYINRLKDQNQLFTQGDKSTLEALQQFDQERSQIEMAHKWVISQMETDIDVMVLCIAFAVGGHKVLRVRLTPIEFENWVHAGLAAAQRLHDELNEANHLFLLGTICIDVAKYKEAIPYFEAALKLEQKLHKPEILVSALSGLAAAYQSLGDYKRAKEYQS